MGEPKEGSNDLQKDTELDRFKSLQDPMIGIVDHEEESDGNT